MPTIRALLAALVAVAFASPARAQLAAQDRERGIPAGLTLPAPGAAAAEEPIALDVNPAGVGFVGGFTLQYFHEGVPERSTNGDGVYLADRFGPLAIGFGHEWLRPGDAPLARYRRSRLAFAVGDGRSSALGVGWTWIRSDDGALEEAGSWDIGVTARPFRHLSLAAAALGNDARVGEARLPVRFDLGVAARGWRDRATLFADLIADDDGRAFRPTYVRAGLGIELGSGLAASLRVEVPVRDEPGRGREASGLLTLGWNEPHAGLTAGATRFDGRTGWLAGVRLSQQRYLSGGSGRGLASIRLPRDLEPERFLFLVIGDRDPYAQLVDRLLAAADDPEVGALLLRIDGVPLGSGRVEELRTLVARVRAKKPVLAYLTGGGTREYWLASAATAVGAPPGAPLLVNGFSSAQLYYRDLLARLGVAVQVVRAGAYKSATEPLVRTGPSPEAAEVRDAILDDVYGRFVADVAAARRLDPQRVRALVDQGLFSSDEGRAAGLLDATPWPDEVERWAEQVADRRLGDPFRYRPEPPRTAQRWGRPPVVEVIRLSGIIARGPQPAGRDAGRAEEVADAVHRAAEDPEVRAIVLRVDSPGGDAFASDLLWREVMQARRKGKPVVASMGDVAASGGYLVAAAADTIVAEPSTLTGSIGVFAAKPDLAGLLEKLSVQRSAAARGDKAGALSLLRPWSDAERAAVQRQVDAFYATFLDRVAEGRKLPRAEVEKVAAGRVFTGRQALERRLVDRLGTLADAIEIASAAAGLAEGEAVVRRAGRRGMLPSIASSPLGRADGGAPLERLARLSPELEVMFLLADGSLGPILLLPDEWVGTTP